MDYAESLGIVTSVGDRETLSMADRFTTLVQDNKVAFLGENVSQLSATVEALWLDVSDSLSALAGYRSLVGLRLNVGAAIRISFC